ncbi:MAG: response regulator [Steroidobacteraceae bacterium]
MKAGIGTRSDEASGLRDEPLLDIVTASDGTEALDRIEEQQPDLIVTEQSMPRMTRLKLCGHLRVRPETQGIPVIVLSGQEIAPMSWLYDKAVLKPSPLSEIYAELRLLLISASLRLSWTNRYRRIA